MLPCAGPLHVGQCIRLGLDSAGDRDFSVSDPQNKDHRFIPLRLDTSSIKNSLAPFLYIDWLSASCEQEYAKLLAACWPETSQLLSEQQQTHRQFLEKIGSLGHTHFIWSVAWSPDGQHALLAVKIRRFGCGTLKPAGVNGCSKAIGMAF